MPSIGVDIAIIRDSRIVLIKREDFEVWCLPGGAVEDGESLAQAAIREAREETGLEVRLTQLVGVYSHSRWHDGSAHLALFAAWPIGGALRRSEDETVDIGYFDRADLPQPLVPWHRQMIADALDGAAGVAWSLSQPWPFESYLSRREIYALRDQSGLSRQQFYLRYFERSEPEDDILEVGGRAE